MLWVSSIIPKLPGLKRFLTSDLGKVGMSVLVEGLAVDFARQGHTQMGVTDSPKYSVVRRSTPRRIMPAKFPVLEFMEQDDEGRRVDSTKPRVKV